MSEQKKVIGRPFPPGNRANPGGRAKGYERQFREVIDGMTANDPVVDPEARYTAEGDARRIPAWQAIIKRAVLDAVKGDRHAREWIADRLMGKPKQHVDIKPVTTRAKADLSGVPTEKKREFLAVYEVMKDLVAPEPLPEDDDQADVQTEH